MTRVALFFLSCLLFSGAVGAEDLKTYWNPKYPYGIAYPSSWTITTVGTFMEQDTFSVMNGANDVNINVMANQVSLENRGRYRSITDIPNAMKELSDVIRTQNGSSAIQSGTTLVSNEPALWFKYFRVHRSLSQEVWFAIYQLSSLRNDVTYTITGRFQVPSATGG